MGRWDKAVEEQRAIIQAAVPEPVIASGVLQPAGTWGAMGLSRLSGAASMYRQHRANKAAGDLTGRHGLKLNSQTYMALTADKLYALEGKVSGRKIKIVGTLAEWRRADLQVQLIPGRVSTKVVFDHADGGHYELEATTMMGNYNNPLLAELGTMAAA
jgi:hypothetical protein